MPLSRCFANARFICHELALLEPTGWQHILTAVTELQVQKHLLPPPVSIVSSSPEPSLVVYPGSAEDDRKAATVWYASRPFEEDVRRLIPKSVFPMSRLWDITKLYLVSWMSSSLLWSVFRVSHGLLESKALQARTSGSPTCNHISLARIHGSQGTEGCGFRLTTHSNFNQARREVILPSPASSSVNTGEAG